MIIISGRHYDYGYRRVSDLAENIRQDIEKYKTDGVDDEGFKYEALRKEILEYMKIIADGLEKHGAAAHDLEWLMSGDYGDDTFLSCMQEIFKEAK